MPQLNDLSRSLVTLEQDATLIAVIEMGQSSWLVLPLRRRSSNGPAGPEMPKVEVPIV